MKTHSSDGLTPRLATGAIFMAITLFCLWQGGLLWFSLLCLVGWIALVEMWPMAQRRWHSAEGLLSLAALPLLLASAALEQVAIAAALLAAVSLLAAFCSARKGFSPLWALLGVPLPVGALMLASWLTAGDRQNDGAILLAWLLAVIVANDSGSFAAGRFFGGPRLAPALSPNKTWAGSLGGLVCAALVAVAGGFVAQRCLWGMEGVSLLPLLFLGAGVALAAQMGDLLESGLKRRAGVKDSGRLLPGHGGMLDRLDSLIAAIWFVVLFAVLRQGAFHGDAVITGLLSWT